VLRATWIDFQVGGDAVRVDDRLEDIGELVGLVVGRRRLLRLHAVQYRRHAAAAALLRHKQRVTNEVGQSSTASQNT